MTAKNSVCRAPRAATQASTLVGLSNLGPRSIEFLAAAGIDSLATLAALGSVAAFARVKQVHPRASLNLLWALEGVLTGLHWREVAQRHRTSLLLALESHERQRQANMPPPA